jgi:hypothetical protein
MFNTSPYNLVGLTRPTELPNVIVRLREATRFEKAPERWRVVTPETLSTIDEPVLDRKVARAALKAYRYPEYLTWRDAYVAHDGEWGANVTRWGGVMDMLAAGPEGWVSLIGVFSDDELRRYIYKAEGCVSWVAHPFVSGWAELRRVQRNRKAWRWL